MFISFIIHLCHYEFIDYLFYSGKNKSGCSLVTFLCWYKGLSGRKTVDLIDVTLDGSRKTWHDGLTRWIALDLKQSPVLSNSNLPWDPSPHPSLGSRELNCLFCLFRLEAGCSFDYIEIFDGPHHSSPLIARVCDGARGSFTSTSNFMSVRFISDHMITQRGFQAEYYTDFANNITSKFPCQNKDLVELGTSLGAFLSCTVLGW